MRMAVSSAIARQPTFDRKDECARLRVIAVNALSNTINGTGVAISDVRAAAEIVGCLNRRGPSRDGESAGSHSLFEDIVNDVKFHSGLLALFALAVRSPGDECAVLLRRRLGATFHDLSCIAVTKISFNNGKVSGAAHLVDLTERTARALTASGTLTCFCALLRSATETARAAQTSSDSRGRAGALASALALLVEAVLLLCVLSHSIQATPPGRLAAVENELDNNPFLDHLALLAQQLSHFSEARQQLAIQMNRLGHTLRKLYKAMASNGANNPNGFQVIVPAHSCMNYLLCSHVVLLCTALDGERISYGLPQLLGEPAAWHGVNDKMAISAWSWAPSYTLASGVLPLFTYDGKLSRHVVAWGSSLQPPPQSPPLPQPKCPPMLPKIASCQVRDDQKADAEEPALPLTPVQSTDRHRTQKGDQVREHSQSVCRKQGLDQSQDAQDADPHERCGKLYSGLPQDLGVQVQRTNVCPNDTSTRAQPAPEGAPGSLTEVLSAQLALAALTSWTRTSALNPATGSKLQDWVRTVSRLSSFQDSRSKPSPDGGCGPAVNATSRAASVSESAADSQSLISVFVRHDIMFWALSAMSKVGIEERNSLSLREKLKELRAQMSEARVRMVGMQLQATTSSPQPKPHSGGHPPIPYNVWKLDQMEMSLEENSKQFDNHVRELGDREASYSEILTCLQPFLWLHVPPFAWKPTHALCMRLFRAAMASWTGRQVAPVATPVPAAASSSAPEPVCASAAVQSSEAAAANTGPHSAMDDGAAADVVAAAAAAAAATATTASAASAAGHNSQVQQATEKTHPGAVQTNTSPPAPSSPTAATRSGEAIMSTATVGTTETLLLPPEVATPPRQPPPRAVLAAVEAPIVALVSLRCSITVLLQAMADLCVHAPLQSLWLPPPPPAPAKELATAVTAVPPPPPPPPELSQHYPGGDFRYHQAPSYLMRGLVEWWVALLQAAELAAASAAVAPQPPAATGLRDFTPGSSDWMAGESAVDAAQSLVSMVGACLVTAKKKSCDNGFCGTSGVDGAGGDTEKGNRVDASTGAGPAATAAGRMTTEAAGRPNVMAGSAAEDGSHHRLTCDNETIMPCEPLPIEAAALSAGWLLAVRRMLLAVAAPTSSRRWQRRLLPSTDLCGCEDPDVPGEKPAIGSLVSDTAAASIATASAPAATAGSAPSAARGLIWRCLPLSQSWPNLSATWMEWGFTWGQFLAYASDPRDVTELVEAGRELLLLSMADFSAAAAEVGDSMDCCKCSTKSAVETAAVVMAPAGTAAVGGGKHSADGPEGETCRCVEFQTHEQVGEEVRERLEAAVAVVARLVTPLPLDWLRVGRKEAAEGRGDGHGAPGAELLLQQLQEETADGGVLRHGGFRSPSTPDCGMQRPALASVQLQQPSQTSPSPLSLQQQQQQQQQQQGRGEEEQQQQLEQKYLGKAEVIRRIEDKDQSAGDSEEVLVRNGWNSIRHGREESCLAVGGGIGEGSHSGTISDETAAALYDCRPIHACREDCSPGCSASSDCSRSMNGSVSGGDDLYASAGDGHRGGGGGGGDSRVRGSASNVNGDDTGNATTGVSASAIPAAGPEVMGPPSSQAAQCQLKESMLHIMERLLTTFTQALHLLPYNAAAVQMHVMAEARGGGWSPGELFFVAASTALAWLRRSGVRSGDFVTGDATARRPRSQFRSYFKGLMSVLGLTIRRLNQLQASRGGHSDGSLLTREDMTAWEMLAVEQVARALLCMMCELPKETREAFGIRPNVHDGGANGPHGGGGGGGRNGFDHGNNDFGGAAARFGHGLSYLGNSASEFGDGNSGLVGVDSGVASAAELDGVAGAQEEIYEAACGLCIASCRQPLQSMTMPPTPLLPSSSQSVGVAPTEAVAATAEAAPLSYDDVRSFLGPAGQIPFPKLLEELTRLLGGGQPPSEAEYSELRHEICMRCRGGQ